MKRLILILLFGFTCAGYEKQEIEVYNKLYKSNIITTGDIKEIHKKLEINKTCIGNGYITLNIGNIVSIEKLVINICNENMFKYMLLHEIGHFVYYKYNLQIPLIATGTYKDKSPEELYSESFTQLYY